MQRSPTGPYTECALQRAPARKGVTDGTTLSLCTQPSSTLALSSWRLLSLSQHGRWLSLQAPTQGLEAPRECPAHAQWPAVEGVQSTPRSGSNQSGSWVLV